MKKNSTDIFESTSSNIFNKSTESNSNFFVSEDNSAITFPSIPVSDRQRRLNDYDFNLLREDAYKDISDDLFKLEYKISKVESEIKFLETQIQAACDINDNDLVFELSERKKLAEEDYESLVVFADGSWKNEKAYYNASTSKLKYYGEETYTTEEVQAINAEVSLKISMSSKAIKNNYFNYLENKIDKYEEQKEEIIISDETIDLEKEE